MTKHRGDIFECLAIKQTRKQEVALGPHCQLFVQVHVVATRKQTASLQFDKGGCDEQELCRHIQVEHLHALNLFEIGLNDAGQRYLMDIYFLFQNEVQQEVERTVVNGGRYLKCHADRLVHKAEMS